MRILASLFAFLSIVFLTGPVSAADTAAITPVSTATPNLLRETCNPALVIPGVVELRKIGCPDQNHARADTGDDNGGGDPHCGYGAHKKKHGHHKKFSKHHKKFSKHHKRFGKRDGKGKKDHFGGPSKKNKHSRVGGKKGKKDSHSYAGNHNGKKTKSAKRSGSSKKPGAKKTGGSKNKSAKRGGGSKKHGVKNGGRKGKSARNGSRKGKGTRGRRG